MLISIKQKHRRGGKRKKERKVKERKEGRQRNRKDGKREREKVQKLKNFLFFISYIKTIFTSSTPTTTLSINKHYLKSSNPRHYFMFLFTQKVYVL